MNIDALIVNAITGILAALCGYFFATLRSKSIISHLEQETANLSSDVLRLNEEKKPS